MNEQTPLAFCAGFCLLKGLDCRLEGEEVMSSSSESAPPAVGAAGNVMVSKTFSMSDYSTLLEPSPTPSAAQAGPSSAGQGLGGIDGLPFLDFLGSCI